MKKVLDRTKWSAVYMTTRARHVEAREEVKLSMLTNRTQPIGAEGRVATALVSSCAATRRGGFVVARGRVCLSSLPTYLGGESGHKLAGVINDPRVANGRNQN
jgi:hypothetical protein